MLSSTCRVCSRIVRDGDLARNEEHGASTQIDADGVGEDRRDARALEGVDATRRLPGQIDAGPFHGREDTAEFHQYPRSLWADLSACCGCGATFQRRVSPEDAPYDMIFTTLLVSWN